MDELTATTVQMAKLLGFTRQSLERIAKAGWVKPRAPNTWGVIETFQNMLRYERDERRRSAQSVTQSRVAEARAKEIELRTAQRAGELCETEEALSVCDEIFGLLRADLTGLPATVSRDLQIRRDIEKAVNDILNKTAARLGARARDLRAG